MRLVYVDEAGIGSKTQEPYTVVAGVLIDADKKLDQVEAELQKIIEKLVPQQYKYNFVIHAKELWNGGKTVIRDELVWPYALRMSILEKVCQLPRKLQLPIALGYIDRSNFPKTFVPDPPLSPRDSSKFAHVVAYSNCAIALDRWMCDNTNNEVCLMVVEDNEEARSLIRDTQRYHQDKNRTDLNEIEKKYLPLRRIKEDPLFQGKRAKSALQLADVCAFVFKRHLMGDKKVSSCWNSMNSMVFGANIRK
ncbi:MAG: DUF3800 domain-containing protein [Burkholderiaceae bacterium]